MYESQVDTSPNGPVVVFGGSGFIGTRLGEVLMERRVAFRIGDIHKSLAFPHLWEHCDVRELGTLRGMAKGSTTIINLAAEHRDDVRPLSRYYDVNVGGAVRVCEAARQVGVQRVIFTSTVAVYGFQTRPVDEYGPFEPFNEYGKTKLEAERVYRAWAEEDHARTLVIIRPTVVFGEGNRGNVYNLLRQIAKGNFLMVGTGKNVKSIAYVGNVAAFLAYSLSMEPGVHIFNYVDGPDMCTADLISNVRRCFGKTGTPVRAPRSIAMFAGYGFDLLARASGRTFPISAIRVRKFCESTQFQADRIAATDFKPPYTLAEGLARTIQHDFLTK